MRVVQPPPSNEIQYIESPELVQRLVDLQRQLDQLRLSSPKPVIKEVIKEIKYTPPEVEKELQTLRQVQKAYEELRLKSPKQISSADVTTKTLKEVVTIEKVSKKFIAIAAVGSLSLFGLGLLLGKILF